jgi:hypothetical protein
MPDPQETMDKLTDTKRLVKIKAFRIVETDGINYEFENWQTSNPKIKILNMYVAPKIETNTSIQNTGSYGGGGYSTGSGSVINIPAPSINIFSTAYLYVIYEDTTVYKQ